jgi:hypothetical protein
MLPEDGDVYACFLMCQTEQRWQCKVITHDKSLFLLPYLTAIERKRVSPAAVSVMFWLLQSCQRCCGPWA